MAVDPKDQAELNKLYNDYVRLLQAADKINLQQAKNMADVALQAGTLNANIARLNTELNDAVFRSDSLAKSFAETTAEIKNQNVLIQAGKTTFKGLADLASDLNYYQKGITDQSEKQLKKKGETLAKSQLELSNIKSQLENKNGEYRQQETLNKLNSIGFDNLTTSQKKLYNELAKEKDLLEAANNAIEEGLPLLQQELNISKQIYRVKEDLGGMATAAAGVVSKYGGSLANFLKVDDAIESVKNYNQNLIDGALKSKEVIAKLNEIEDDRLAIMQRSLIIQGEIKDLQDQIREIEANATEEAEKRLELTKIQSQIQVASVEELVELEKKELALQNQISALAKERTDKTGPLETKIQIKKNELLEDEKKTKQDLLELDKEEQRVKQKAIESVNTFGNKLKSLGVLATELGSGLKKALTDPLTIITFIIDRALTANAQVVELGKSFGVSAKSAENIRQEVTSFARATGDTFVTTERLLKAQSELSKQLGIAVQFSNEELETFSKLTELTGLSSESAAKLARAAAVTGTPTKEYTNELRKSAFFAQQSTNTHFSSREILEDIGKLSSGILIKFRGNTDAMARTVVEAKKLGLTLDQIDKVGESLLNWEQSIENELKAELLTGRELNMEKARAAALSGDQLTLTKEIASQVGSLEDYQNMNVIAQKSLAEAFGMSREEMSEMLMQQEAINRYGSEAAKLNKEQIEDMERQGLSLDEYLEKQEQQRTAQQKFQDAITKLQDIIGSLFDGPVGQLVDAFADLLTTAVNILSIFSPIFDVISGIAEFISDIASSTTGKWVIGLTAAAFLIPKIAGGIVGIFGSIGNIGKGITEAFSPKGFSSFFEGLFNGFKKTDSLAGSVADKAKETITESVADKAKGAVTDKAKEAVSGKAEDIVSDNVEKVTGGGDKLKGGGDGEDLKKKLQNIAEGLKSFASTDVFLGALNLIPTAIGFTAMIPGAIGAKLVSLVDGEKLKTALVGMAEGLKEFGNNNIFAGAGNLIVASIGLTGMIPGAIGAKLISLVDGDKFKTAMDGIANGIISFGNNNLLRGAINLAIASIGLTLMIPGAIGAKLVSLVDGEKFQETMYGLAYGIESFASTKVAVGSVAMILAAAGLTAMIPGAIGAKLVSLVDGEKFESTVKSITRGIEAFASTKVIVGSFAMVLAAAGLTAMIPGAIGAKLISLVDGEKFEESSYGITYGIEAFASTKVAVGSLAMVLAGIGLTAMIPGAIAAKLISLVDGEKFEKSMVGIAKGIEGFFDTVSYGTIIKAALSIALLGASLIPAAYAFKMFGDVTWDAVAKGFITLGGLAIVGYAMGKAADSMLKGAFAIAVLGVSLIPAAYALQMFAEIEWESLAKAGVTLVGLGIAGAILGSMATQMLKGAFAIAVLGASLIPAAYALQMFADISWEDMAKAGVALVGLGIAGAAFGALMPLMLMGAIAIAALGAALLPFGIAANLVALAAPGLSTLFDALNNVNTGNLLLIGPALASVGIGLAALGAGNVIDAIGSFLAGDPVEKIERLAAAGTGLQTTASALQNMATALTSVSAALASIDISKLGALDEFASNRSSDSVVGGIVDFITAPIKAIGGESSEEGKGEAINAGGIDLTPMVNAINEVKAAVDNLQNRPIKLYIDSTEVTKKQMSANNSI